MTTDAHPSATGHVSAWRAWWGPKSAPPPFEDHDQSRMLFVDWPRQERPGASLLLLDRDGAQIRYWKWAGGDSFTFCDLAEDECRRAATVRVLYHEQSGRLIDRDIAVPEWMPAEEEEE